MSIQFLNYHNPRHLARISQDAIRSTEGINSADATLQVTASHYPPLLYRLAQFTCIVSVRKSYVDPAGITVLYHNSKQAFAPTALYPPNERYIKNITLQIQSIHFPDAITPILAPYIKERMRAPLWSCDFPAPEPNSTLRITQHGMIKPVFTEPNTGARFPLWQLGGKDAGVEQFSQWETVLASPVQDAHHPDCIQVLRIPWSQMCAKDPLLKNGNSAQFHVLPQSPQPFHFKELLTKGAIEMTLPTGQKFRSAAVALNDNQTLKLTMKKEKQNDYTI